MRPFFRYLGHVFSIPMFVSMHQNRFLRSLVVLPLGFPFLLPQTVVTPDMPSEAIINPQVVADRLTHAADLPIADIKLAHDDDDIGTVIFLPQYHRYPGSAVEDERNDVGFATQQELHEILQQVMVAVKADTVFVEGEFQGRVPEAERERLKIRISTLEEFERQLAQVKTILGPYLSEQELEALLTEAESSAARARRGIVLEGAPEQLWAEGASLALYGTENPVTRELSADLVRDHIYLRDQMKRVTSVSVLPDMSSGLFDLSDDTRAMLYQRLLESYHLNATSSSSLLQRWIELQMTDQVSVGATRSAFDVLDSLKQKLPAESLDTLMFVDSLRGSWQALLQEPEETTTSAHVPSRSANPYQEIFNRSELEHLLQENERQIEDIVVERRNQETADVVLTVMQDQGEDVAIVQFGAGHEEGLVEALRQRNLSVITLIPNAVAEGRLMNK